MDVTSMHNFLFPSCKQTIKKIDIKCICSIFIDSTLLFCPMTLYFLFITRIVFEKPNNIMLLGHHNTHNIFSFDCCYSEFGYFVSALTIYEFL